METVSPLRHSIRARCADRPFYLAVQVNFVKVVRAVELALGIPVASDGGLLTNLLSGIDSNNATASLLKASQTLQSDSEVALALADATPILVDILIDLGITNVLFGGTPLRSPLVTRYVAFGGSLFGAHFVRSNSFMDIGWQHNSPSNPADAQIGPQGYDSHLYYSYAVVVVLSPRKLNFCHQVRGRRSCESRGLHEKHL